MQQDRIDHTAAFAHSRNGETAICLIYVKPTEGALTFPSELQPKLCGRPDWRWRFAKVCGCEALC
jgi:hypothetical protein